MWVLIQEPKGGGAIEGLESGIASWALVPGNVYTVGRTPESSIQSPGDTSISKQHAKLCVNTTKEGERPEVLLEDQGSKFGTHLNAGIMSESQRLVTDTGGVLSRALTKPVKLKDNDRVRFGVMFSIYRLKWMILSVTTSMLRSKRELEGWLGKIEVGTKIQANWTRDATHLVMSSISLSAKAVNSLATGVPIVTQEYFRDFLSSALSQQRLPSSGDYTPSVSTTDTESQLRDPGINFRVNTGRRSVFSGATFLFFESKQLAANTEPVSLGGGKAVAVTVESQLQLLTAPGHIAVQPPGHANSLKLSQRSSSQQGTQPPVLWLKALQILSAAGLSSVPQTAVYLAIVHCSTATHCNPRHRPQTLSTTASTSSNTTNQTRTVLAPDTEDMEETQTQPILDPTSETQAPNKTLSISETSREGSQRGLKRTVSDDKEEPDTPLLNTEDASSYRIETPSHKKLKLAGVTNVTSSESIIQRSDSNKENRVNNAVRENGDGPMLKSSNSNESQKNSQPPENDSQSRKRVLSSEDNDKNVVKSATQKRRMIESPNQSARDDDDIFGFGNSPEKTREPSSLSVRLKKPKSKDDEIFAFDDSDDESELAKLSTCKKIDPIPETAPSLSVIGPSIESTSHVKNSRKVLKSDESKESTSVVKKVPEISIKISKNKSLDSTGFVGKGDVTITKSEYVEEELSKSICKLLTVSLMRKDATLPHYVPAADPTLLGKPTVNFKKFKKQQVITARKKATLGPYIAVGDQTLNPRISEWLESHHEVTRLEQDSEERSKEKEDFWDFMNSQEEANVKKTQRTISSYRRK